MKKLTNLFLLFLVLFSLSACKKEPKYMDQPHTDGNYYYSNQDLEFGLVLPPEFIYYQTQRVQGSGYVQVEFFVPTSDKRWQIIPGYAMPVVVRVWEESTWNEMPETDRENFSFLQSKNNKVYSIKFWDEAPQDWTNKWTDEKRDEILNNFNLK